MFDLIAEASNLFTNMTSFYEVAVEANATFSCTISNLPPVTQLKSFLNSFRNEDSVELSIKSYLDFSYSSLCPQQLEDNYLKFIDSSEPEDSVTINIHINKSFDDRDSLTIYSFENFVTHYANRSFEDLIHELAFAFKKHSHLIFYVMDKEVNLSTESICFYSNSSMLTKGSTSREEYINYLNNATLFLNRNEFPLTPYDFRILQNVSVDIPQLVSLLNKLETIFSCIYLAYSSQIANDQVVLQLSPATGNISFTYKEAFHSQYICDLYQWAFIGDHAIERIGIVRNLLELNCQSAEALNLKDESLLLSAKSNFILFQKKTIDKYIELKNSISLAIVEATNNMQETLQTLVDAVRNNFIAVVMFLITVIITDSVSWDDFINGTVLNSDLLLVIKIFCISSFLYLLVTLIGIKLKWAFFSRGYNEIKRNYSDLLDKNDLLRAFDNDRAIKHVRNSIIIASSITTIIWILFLFVICKLVW